MNVVQRLTESARPKLAEHFLKLGAEDVRLRFGAPHSPEAIVAYVARIDFGSDAVVGVYDEELSLSGVAHIALGADAAELGVSVLPQHRGQGGGCALVAGAVVLAR